MLAVLGMVTAAANASRASWGDHGEDVSIIPVGGRSLDARAAALIRATPGVAAIEPRFTTDVKLDGKDARIWAVQQATMFHHRIAAGRWYTPAEEQTRAHVAVIEQAIAGATGTRLGDTITVQTESGPASFRVIGISPQQQESGTALYVPLTTMHAVLTGMPADASDFWVRTTSHDHAFIDRTTTRIEDTLTAHGYDVTSEVVYVRLADEIAGYRTVTTTLAAVGLLVVAIGLAGLANALTMSVLERTREIGILRSIGARARDIRRIFAAETLTPGRRGLADRDPARLPARPVPRLDGQEGRQCEPHARLPALEPRARPGRHHPARPPDHPGADPARRSPPARRRAALRIEAKVSNP
jgi:ABC-type lipoprotein release transport system permease subunit